MTDPTIVTRTLTELDHIRLTNLIRRSPARNPIDANDLLVSILDNAELVAPQQVRPDTITMYSQIMMADCDTGTHNKLTLCYPHDAEPAQGFISVLSPIGTSLIGLEKGDIACWSGPDGKRNSAQVQAILFQPEASGDYLI